MSLVNRLVSVIFTYLIHLLESADEQLFQAELRGYTQIQRHFALIMVCLERFLNLGQKVLQLHLQNS